MNAESIVVCFEWEEVGGPTEMHVWHTLAVTWKSRCANTLVSERMSRHKSFVISPWISNYIRYG